MTGGTVVILGAAGANLGAGMTGGRAFVLDADERLHLRLDTTLVSAEPLDVADAAELRGLLDRHVRYTGSSRAALLLESWDEVVRWFRRVAPRPDVVEVERAQEGSSAGA
jgi:glutamate synthase (ferredoxin)